jgi:hypothetical protein
MNTTRKQNHLAPPACAAAIISVQRAKHQTSRFEELANLPFKENRRTKDTAKTLRNKLHAPAQRAASGAGTRGIWKLSFLALGGQLVAVSPVILIRIWLGCDYVAPWSKGRERSGSLSQRRHIKG